MLYIALQCNNNFTSITHIYISFLKNEHHLEKVLNVLNYDKYKAIEGKISCKNLKIKFVDNEYIVLDTLKRNYKNCKVE